MKNLKKVLSLALAFAMVLGLCIGAMAAEAKDVTKLTDWADVTNKDAAQLLNAFNIMQGDDKGNFNPAKNVTRAEAAKMISVALWGGDDLSDMLKDSTTKFTDVHSNDWFAGYVAFAANYGIVAGKNETTFDPKGSVTGYELLKMALTALGYDQTEEGLVGDNWKFNTMYLAIGTKGQKNLTDGVDVTDWNLALSRDNAAQVIANMTKRTIVDYGEKGLFEVTTGTDNAKVSFGTNYLGVKEDKAILVANTYGKVSKIGTTSLTGMTTAVEDNGENAVVLLLTSDGKVPENLSTESYKAVSTNSGLYDLGAYATLYSKDNKIISVAITAPTVVTPAADGSNYADDIENLSTVTIGSTGHEYKTTLDTNADGKIDLITTVKYEKVAPVADVVTSPKHGTVYVTSTASWRSTYEKIEKLPDALLTDVVFADGTAAAKGDMIAYVGSANAFTNTTTANVTVAVVLDSIDGTIDRVASGSPDYTYYINGVAHEGEAQGEGTGYLYGTEGTFYFYPDGYIAAVNAPEVSNDELYAVVYKIGYEATKASTGVNGGVGSVKIQVAATLQDNTTGIFDVARWNGITVSKLTGEDDDNFKAIIPNTNATARDANQLVTYTLNDDGSINITTTTGTANVTGDMKTGTAKIGEYFFDSKTVTFVFTGTTTAEAWTAYIGIPTFDYKVTGSTAVTKALYRTDDGIKAILVSEGTTETPKASAFVYVFKNNGQIGWNDATQQTPVYELSVYDANTGTVGTIESTTAAEAGDFYQSYDAASKSLGTEITDAALGTKGFVTVCSNNVIVLGKAAKDETEGNIFKPENTVLTYGTSTKFYVIDGEDSKAITAADVEVQTIEGQDATTGEFNPNYYQALVLTDETTTDLATRVILFAEVQETEAE